MVDDDVESYRKSALLAAARRSGDIVVLESVIDSNGITKSDMRHGRFRAFCLACQGGNLDIVKWLVQRFNLNETEIFKGNEQLVCCVCWGGHLEVARWLTEQFCNEDNEDAWSEAAITSFRYACRNGHLDVARWVAERFGINGERARGDKNLAHRMALEHGHTHVVSWLLLTF